MIKKLLGSLHKIFILSFIISACSYNAQANADDVTEKVATALSGYHANLNNEQLENIAGGQDNLVSSLLKLRTTDKLPFVSIRSEKLLLKYAERSDVATALKNDMQDKNLRGLAGAIALHIDRVSDAGVRRTLAQMATSRAKEDADFGSYTAGFANSEDPEVRKLFVGK